MAGDARGPNTAQPGGSGLAEIVGRTFDELRALAEAVPLQLEAEIEEYAEHVIRVLRAGGRLFFCGNGGSAADAQHLAAEYVVRLEADRGSLPAIALTTDTSVLTAASNDYGFEQVFARQLEALARPGDLLVLHSTSGESENLLRAAAVARQIGLTSVGVLAKGGGRLRDQVDLAVVVPTQRTSRAQEVHLAIGHAVCEAAEAALFA